MISRAALKAVSRGARRTDIVTLEPALLDLDGMAGADEAASGATGALAGDGTAGDGTAGGGAVGANGVAGPAPLALREALEATRRDVITAALARHHGAWAAAARDLGIDASNLHKLARRLGLKDVRRGRERSTDAR